MSPRSRNFKLRRSIAVGSGTSQSRRPHKLPQAQPATKLYRPIDTTSMQESYTCASPCADGPRLFIADDISLLKVPLSYMPQLAILSQAAVFGIAARFSLYLVTRGLIRLFIGVFASPGGAACRLRLYERGVLPSPGRAESLPRGAAGIIKLLAICRWLKWLSGDAGAIRAKRRAPAA